MGEWKEWSVRPFTEDGALRYIHQKTYRLGEMRKRNHLQQ